MEEAVQGQRPHLPGQAPNLPDFTTTVSPQAKRFYMKASCAYCHDRIWGLGRQGFKCIQYHKLCDARGVAAMPGEYCWRGRQVFHTAYADSCEECFGRIKALLTFDPAAPEAMP